MSSLTDMHGVGVRQALAFGRKKGNDVATVGRFFVMLKLVGDYMTKYGNFGDGANMTGPKTATSGVHLIPPEDPNFKWRVRVDLRAALDVPPNRTTP